MAVVVQKNPLAPASALPA